MKRPRGVRRRSALLCALAAGPATLVARALGAAPRYNVLDVKTAIIGRIAEFVRWPAEVGLTDPHRPFEFVVLGDTPLEPYFARYYGDAGGDHRRVTGCSSAGPGRWTTSARRTCCSSAHPWRTAWTRCWRPSAMMPVLTMGDTFGYASRGLAVNLYLVDRPGPVRDLPAGVRAAAAVSQLPAAGPGPADRRPAGEAVMRASISRKLLAVTVGVISVAVALAGRLPAAPASPGAVSGVRRAGRWCWPGRWPNTVMAPLVFEDPRGRRPRSWPSWNAATTWPGRCCSIARATSMATYNRDRVSAPRLPLHEPPARLHRDGYLHVFEPVFHRGVQQGTCTWRPARPP